ncbi:MAG: hypothetical protein ACK5MV_13770 [Aminipila sp.]
MENERVSITRLAQGAIEERINLEVPKILDNIADLNTEASKKRTLTITLDFVPDKNRQNITLKATVKSKLEATNPIQTSIAVGFDHSTGEQIAVELVPNIPGQMNMAGEEQEQPKVIKLMRA